MIASNSDLARLNSENLANNPLSAVLRTLFARADHNVLHVHSGCNWVVTGTLVLNSQQETPAAQ